jgi:hypothetical protein
MGRSPVRYFAVEAYPQPEVKRASAGLWMRVDSGHVLFHVKHSALAFCSRAG